MNDIEKQQGTSSMLPEAFRIIIAIGQFKLELQPKNANFGLNRWFLSRVTSKFEGWPCENIGHLI